MADRSSSDAVRSDAVSSDAVRSDSPFAAAAERFGLGAIEQLHFRRQGYCVVPDGLADEELQMLRHVVGVLMTEEPDDDGGGQLHDIGRGRDRRFLRLRHEDFPPLASLLLESKLGLWAAALLGAHPYLFVEQFVVKGPSTGAAFGWHQDSGYVGFDHEPYLTFWVALDDATVDNGCLRVLPRDLDVDGTVVAHCWNESAKERIGYTGSEPGDLVECRAGTVVAFSSLTMHCSGPNATEHQRRAYVCQYSPEPIIDPATGSPKHFAKQVLLPGT